MIDLLRRMTLDEQSIRAVRSHPSNFCMSFNALLQTFSTANLKNGSAGHISLISDLMPKLPATCIPEAISTLCSVLDVPAFPPEQPLPSSLSLNRSLALNCLMGLAKIPSSVFYDEQSPSYSVLERNWPIICNWTHHFHHELTTSQLSSSPSSMKQQWPIFIVFGIPSMISHITYNDEVFKRLTF